jgi:hypothetical protein
MIFGPDGKQMLESLRVEHLDQAVCLGQRRS